MPASTKWKWDQPQEDAFKKLKQMLTDNTVLAHFDPSCPVGISCDTSNNRVYKSAKNSLKSVRPEVRGSTDFDGGAIPHPKRPPRTPSRRSSFFASDGRAETDSYF